MSADSRGYTGGKPGTEMGPPKQIPSGRNVIDYYKTWETDAIKADLDTKRNDMVTICMNLTGDFNKASIVRNNNAFMGREVWMVGKKKFDKRGTVGTHHYEHVKHTDDWVALFQYLKDSNYAIVGVDNVPGAVALTETFLPKRSAFVYGEEGLGLSEHMLDACDKIVYIAQGGSVRSINVAVASGIIMHHYVTEWSPYEELSRL